MIRYRKAFFIVGCAIVIGALLFTDPDSGISTAMLLLTMVTPLLAVAFAHLARKALHDYPEADARKLFKLAAESPVGAGLALVAISILMAALLGLFGRAHAAEVPFPALKYMQPLGSELTRYWPEAPMREYVPGLIEHESCITLTHPRCWSSTSRLKTAREEGAGLGQLTRAWSADGSLRFDALAEMRNRHPDLRELDWRTIYQRPDLQMRALILMSRDNYRTLRAVADPMARLAMSDAAYNGGMGGLQKERRACQIAPGCDPGQWFGHVEAHCLKSRAALYAGRSACDINRHHVTDVMLKRAPKYKTLLPSLGVVG